MSAEQAVDTERRSLTRPDGRVIDELLDLAGLGA
jgi:hypothetical protein